MSIIFKDEGGKKWRIKNECADSDKSRVRHAKTPKLSFSQKVSTSSPWSANYSLELKGSTSQSV